MIRHRLASVNKRTLSTSVRRALVHDIAEQLEAVYRHASSETIAQGRQWYVMARDIATGIAHRHNLTLEQSASVIALLSPRTSWETNITNAELAASGSVSFGMFTWQAYRLPMILADETGRSDLVHGPKVESFRANILGDWTRVTVDIWAIRAATGDLTLGDDAYKAMTGTRTRYEILADGYRLAAERAGLSPAELQAVTWLVVRDQLESHRTAYWETHDVPF